MAKKAFTLIEILIVIAIIGILAVVVVIALAQSAKEKARIAAGQQFSDSLRAQMEMKTSSSGTPKHFWKLNNDGNNEWGGPDGVLVGGASIDANGGLNGGALSVTNSGGHQYLRVSVASDLPSDFCYSSDWTVEMWIKPTLTGDSSQNIFNGRYHKPRFMISSSGSLVLQASVVSLGFRGILSVPGIIRADEWQYVAITSRIVDATNSEYKMYYNGDEVSGGGRIFNRVWSGATEYSIGGASWGTEDFDGLIDEVRIYGEAITAYQMQQHYAESAPKYRMTLK